MNFSTRLLLAQSLPIALVSIALGLTLLALTRMTDLLQEVTDVEIRSLKLESDVHHATWLVDIALGQAYSACKSGAVTDHLHEEISHAAEGLRSRLRVMPGVEEDLQDMGTRWLDLAAIVENNVNCAFLGTESFRRERDELDDQLTDLWSHRLAELHAGVAAKDLEARAIGRRALQGGGIIAVSACILATFLSRLLGRGLSQPLASLAATARRVGSGDFSTKVEVSGPSEFTTLANEFERMRERLAQLEQLKQGFLASVSHELRTPLSKLREALAILHDEIVGPLSPKQMRVLSIARSACEREIRMVATLLDLSRLRAGSPIRSRTGRNIDEVIRRAVDEEIAELSNRTVGVRVELEGATPVSHMDAVLVERSVANLVRNALAVSQDGQEVLVQRTFYEEEEGGRKMIRISVSDQGPGVPEDIRDTVFNAFVTSVVPRSPKALGVGLGLALAREVALAHEGELILSSDNESGATFHLLLPAFPPSKVPPRSLAAQAFALTSEGPSS